MFYFLTQLAYGDGTVFDSNTVQHYRRVVKTIYILGMTVVSLAPCIIERKNIQLTA
jgi:hypothetical protein